MHNSIRIVKESLYKNNFPKPKVSNSITHFCVLYPVFLTGSFMNLQEKICSSQMDNQHRPQYVRPIFLTHNTTRQDMIFMKYAHKDGPD